MVQFYVKININPLEAVKIIFFKNNPNSGGNLGSNLNKKNFCKETDQQTSFLLNLSKSSNKNKVFP
jgi:hypothetical protein